MNYYLKKKWKISSLVCLFKISEWGMQTVNNLLLIKIFAAAFALDFNGFLYWNLLNIITWAAYLTIAVTGDYFQGKAVKKLNNDLRHDLYLTLLNKDYVEYHSQDIGEYISWFTNNIKQIELMTWSPFFNSVGRVAQILINIIALAFIDWILLVVAIVVAIIMWIFPKNFEKKIEIMGEDNERVQGRSTGRLKDLLSGLYVLKHFGKESLFIERGDITSDNMESSYSNLNYYSNRFGRFFGLLKVTLSLLPDIIILLLAFAGRIDLSVLGGGGNLISGITYGFENLARFRINIASSKAYFDKINTDVRGQSINTNKINNFKPIEKSIEIENLSFSYGEKEILKDINMRFEKGKKYALVGQSGSGKTTLLKLLLGWQDDYTGYIKFDNKDSNEFSTSDIQRQISYIEQDVYLFNTSIIDNITLNEKYSKGEIDKAIKDSALSNDLKNMPDGLDTIVGEGGKNLSGGQKQRVAIARALIHNHSILLVDEGTSALDRENADIVEESLLNNKDLTLILISHHLSEERKKQFDKVYELGSA